MNCLLLFVVFFNELPALVCSVGGIEMCTPNGKIKVINTLEKRLQFIYEQVSYLPCRKLYSNLLWSFCAPSFSAGFTKVKPTRSTTQCEWNLDPILYKNLIYNTVNTNNAANT